MQYIYTLIIGADFIPARDHYFIRRNKRTNILLFIYIYNQHEYTNTNTHILW